MPKLTEQEQQEIIPFIEADKPLPDKYRRVSNGETLNLRVTPSLTVRLVHRSRRLKKFGPVIKYLKTNGSHSEQNATAQSN